MSRYADHLLNLNRRLEEKAYSNYKRAGKADSIGFIAESPIMKKLLKQAKKLGMKRTSLYARMRTLGMR